MPDDIFNSETQAEIPDYPGAHSCFAHNWPYFRDPVHPYDYSEDWELEKEWNMRQAEKSKKEF